MKRFMDTITSLNIFSENISYWKWKQNKMILLHFRLSDHMDAITVQIFFQKTFNVENENKIKWFIQLAFLKKEESDLGH